MAREQLTNLGVAWLRRNARLVSTLSMIAAVGFPSVALAQNTFPCGHQGRLISLGTSADGSQSIWLSSITTSFTSDQCALYGAVPPFPSRGVIEGEEE
jgi:hypothetical protein